MNLAIIIIITAWISTMEATIDGPLLASSMTVAGGAYFSSR
jgi:hypothetical protein